MIKRFTKSFIGLMEMDNEGKWVLYEDYLRKVDNWQKVAEDWKRYYTEECEDSRKVRLRYSRLLDKFHFIGIMLIFSISINIAQLF